MVRTGFERVKCYQQGKEGSLAGTKKGAGLYGQPPGILQLK
jgi:hypothetical protein